MTIEYVDIQNEALRNPCITLLPTGTTSSQPFKK